MPTITAERGVQGKTGPSPEPNKTQAAQGQSVAGFMYQYIKPHRLAFFFVICCTVLAIAADLLQPYLMKIAIDDNLMTGKNSYTTLIVIGAAYLVLSLCSLVFTYLQNNLLQYAGQSIVARIRKELFAHISKLSMPFFDRMPTGSLITNISSDTETLNQFFTQVVLSMLRDGLTLVLILVMMFHLDAKLALYCMILLPIIAGIAIGFRSYMRKTYQLSRTMLSWLIAFVAENLAGMGLIQAFHQEKEQHERFMLRNRDYYSANLREIRTNVLFNRSFDILGNMSVAFVTWLGGRAVLGHTIEFGVLYAFITYIRQFFQPINSITQQWNTLQSTTVSVNRIWNLFSVAPEIVDRSTTMPLKEEEVRGAVDFHRVRFGYAEGTTVLHDLDLHIRPGEMIGVVGTTGAGKSTLISLLCRFYDPQRGAITLDGRDIRDIPQSSLQRLIGLVQQEPFLYSGSIIDNVRLFDETITREEVIRACEFVGAGDMICSKKDGYDTMLTERGSGLSAGERQLLSFARIIVFKPKVLILDEATANLDSRTEQQLQEALAVVAKNRTTIVIAHRLSTIMQADRIIVMRSGRMIEEGTHEQLIRRKGYYEELYRHSQGAHTLHG
jgi:ATP-binding cassette subfamily B multidrug efflux pump